MSNEIDTLDCQECGNPIKELSPYEAQQVARAPYNFIVYCKWCQEDVKKAVGW